MPPNPHNITLVAGLRNMSSLPGSTMFFSKFFSNPPKGSFLPLKTSVTATFPEDLSAQHHRPIKWSTNGGDTLHPPVINSLVSTSITAPFTSQLNPPLMAHFPSRSTTVRSTILANPERTSRLAARSENNGNAATTTPHDQYRSERIEMTRSSGNVTHPGQPHEQGRAQLSEHTSDNPTKQVERPNLHMNSKHNFQSIINFRVSAQNVNGFGQIKKRDKIILRHRALGDILFFQETFTTQENVDELEKKYHKDKIFYSHGTNRSCGVMIMFKGSLDVDIKKVHRDKNGRLLLITCEIEGINFLLLNVYAPTKKEENANFISEVTDALTVFQTDPIDHILVEGDWNFTEDIDLDRLGGNPCEWPKSVQSMKNLKETFDLVDYWRVKFPDTKQFTWKSLYRGIFSRIDRFYISESLQSIAESTDILPGIYSDHSIVQLTIKSKEFKRGTGFWRLNTNLLGQPEYVNEIKKVFVETNKGVYTDKRAKFDFLNLN